MRHPDLTESLREIINTKLAELIGRHCPSLSADDLPTRIEYVGIDKHGELELVA